MSSIFMPGSNGAGEEVCLVDDSLAMALALALAPPPAPPSPHNLNLKWMWHWECFICLFVKILVENWRDETTMKENIFEFWTCNQYWTDCLVLHYKREQPVIISWMNPIDWKIDVMGKIFDGLCLQQRRWWSCSILEPPDIYSSDLRWCQLQYVWIYFIIRV